MTMMIGFSCLDPGLPLVISDRIRIGCDWIIQHFTHNHQLEPSTGSTDFVQPPHSSRPQRGDEAFGFVIIFSGTAWLEVGTAPWYLTPALHNNQFVNRL